MPALAIFAFVSGVFLGSRYAVLILVPANLIAVAFIAIEAVAFGDGLFAAKAAIVIAVIGLQAGYVCGLGLVLLISSRRRVSDDRHLAIAEGSTAANGSFKSTV